MRAVAKTTLYLSLKGEVAVAKWVPTYTGGEPRETRFEELKLFCLEVLELFCLEEFEKRRSAKRKLSETVVEE